MIYYADASHQQSDNKLVQHFTRSVGEHPTFLGEPTETQHAILKHAADVQH